MKKHKFHFEKLNGQLDLPIFDHDIRIFDNDFKTVSHSRQSGAYRKRDFTNPYNNVYFTLIQFPKGQLHLRIFFTHSKPSHSPIKKPCKLVGFVFLQHAFFCSSFLINRAVCHESKTFFQIEYSSSYICTRFVRAVVSLLHRQCNNR
ncbi:hypothetical protein HanRHA438_Chr04g0194861 [Helianthus annuus]|nr:hypothetical protein HanRHA438_Chr04g0194861 [Helianthus annuus]